MRLCNGPDVFQEKMSTLFHDLECVRTHIDDLLITAKGDLDDHLQKLDTVLRKLRRAGLKINANKSFFCQHELEYLGYWIARDHMTTLPKKEEAICKIARPQNKKDLRSFMGMVNYCGDSWMRRSDLLAPPSELTGKMSRFEWIEKHTKAFKAIEWELSEEAQLQHPDFTKPFEMCTDDNECQLGAVITQSDKPMAFFSVEN